ncbi:ABC transporter permease [Anaerobranca gottschalkii]|uniref:ABC-2 family transporter protein n=1 Tax=Anaerobranca gottschalkii DSM 13577 TaxID=1120990 RepID=A0A1H9YP91_9FIRM|nr:ABC transporter permease [Anaerobranca gottschalkii]SES70962.1 ABC-2 family transporter protein [Anaerobranca gottschalkii DSM 13577]
MKPLYIGLKDIIILVRDKKSLSSLITAPLILTFILGFSLNALWAQGNANNPLGTLLILDNDQGGTFSQLLINEVFFSDEFSSRFVVEIIEDKATGKELVKRGKAVALLQIPHSFSQDILAGNPTTIEILGDSGNEFVPPVILNVTEIFIDEVSVRFLASDEIQRFLTGDEKDLELINTFFDKLEKKEKSIEIAKDLRFARTPDTTNSVSAMGYYSAAMAVMYLLFNANLGGKRILEENEQRTWQRLKTTGITSLKFIFGKTIGIYFSALLQITVLILATSLVYGVKWGNPLSVFLFALIVAFAASGLGIFIAALATSSTSADNLGTFIILIMSAIGGSMWPVYGMPPFMKFLSNFTFNHWALDGFTKIMFLNFHINDLTTNIFYLFLIGVIPLTIAIITLNKRVVS